MVRYMTLNKASLNEVYYIQRIDGEGSLRRRLLDMGLTPHTAVTVRRVAPLGEVIELSLRGYTLTLRRDDAANIVITKQIGES